MEIRKDVVGYEGLYEVSNLGRVRSKYKYIKRNKGSYYLNEKIMNLFNHNHGYLYLTLRINNKSIKKLVHRLVAEAFIENKNNEPCINHKNGNKKDNRVENLEWIDYKQNCLHSVHVLGKRPVIALLSKDNPTSRPVRQYDLQGNIIKDRYCTKDVERELGYFAQNIGACALGIQKTSNGYIRKYVL